MFNFGSFWFWIKNIYFMYLGSVVFNREGLRLGSHSAWGVGCVFNCAGGLSIGSNVLIGPHVFIHTANHRFSDTGKLIREQGHVFKRVVISDDVWIGANVTVLPGVKLGRGCVVGAGSVVVKDVPAFCVVVGNPAKIIKRRGLVGRKELEAVCFS